MSFVQRIRIQCFSGNGNSLETFIIIVVIVGFIYCQRQIFQANYKKRIPLISTSMFTLNLSSKFIGLSGHGFPDVFNVRVILHVAWILEHSRETVKAWLLCDELKRSYLYITMTFMVLGDVNMTLLETIYDDAFMTQSH
eukprot:118070_1